MCPSSPPATPSSRCLLAGLALCWIGCTSAPKAVDNDTDLVPDDPFCSGNAWHPDADLDGYGDRDTTEYGCRAPQPGWIREGGDCNDDRADLSPGQPELPNGLDDDCNDIADDGTDLYDDDGDGACESAVGPCTDGTLPGDCDDADPARYPDADEGCDGVDTNCDGMVPRSEEDRDADGYLACAECDDTRAEAYPGAPEACDGVDLNCDHLVDNLDSDGDGAMACPQSGGSVDVLIIVDNTQRMLPIQGLLAQQTSVLISGLVQSQRDYRIGVVTTDAPDLVAAIITPSTPKPAFALGTVVDVGFQGDDSERPFQQLVHNLENHNTWRRPGAPLAVWIVSNEDDQSWFHIERVLEATHLPGTPLTGRISSISGGWRGCSADTRRADPAPRIQALVEASGGINLSLCDGTWFPEPTDWLPVATVPDCNDADAAIHPLQAESADGVDEDCDGTADVDEDDDQDGVTIDQGDCNDHDPDVFPGAPELCNGRDDNCDGVLPADERDQDGDRWRTCEGDCDDLNNGRNPNTVEVCGDGVDANCNGTDGGPADHLDADGDSYSACQGDCDDLDDTVFPWAPEHAFDHIDNDCDNTIDGRDLDEITAQTALGAESLLTLSSSTRLFNICGGPVQSVHVGANGYLLPNSAPFFSSTPTNAGLRNHAPMVASGWTDLDPSAWDGGGRFLLGYPNRAPVYVVHRTSGMSLVYDAVPYQDGVGTFTGVTTLGNNESLHIAALEGRANQPMMLGYACTATDPVLLPKDDAVICIDPSTEPSAAVFVHTEPFPTRLTTDCSP